MNDIERITSEVARMFFPDQAERSKINALMERLLRDVDAAFGRMDMDVEVKAEIVGSAAKNTYLKGADIDLFLLFPTSVPEERTAEICFLIGREILGIHLATVHNLHFMLDLMREIRDAVRQERFPLLKDEFLAGYRVANFEAGKRDRQAWLAKLGTSKGVSHD